MEICNLLLVKVLSTQSFVCLCCVSSHDLKYMPQRKRQFNVEKYGGRLKLLAENWNRVAVVRNDDGSNVSTTATGKINTKRQQRTVLAETWSSGNRMQALDQDQQISSALRCRVALHRLVLKEQEEKSFRECLVQLETRLNRRNPSPFSGNEIPLTAVARACAR